ncbi:hypothetical protein BS47DRAFT_1358126 [Hydnum rufescens UP504]|uniref:DNA repair protein REV1 n=1 Tax=Hydnum rufescens UP504 TaxID=1448309 RepID=A0A9P6B839_9AGAM|nr:hypothetical protein BS47DRAFT_1358126 [Hydnum rufescens UP504]
MAKTTENLMVLSDHTSDTAIYGASKFGGWSEYMGRKRAKLQIQNREIAEGSPPKPQIFKGVQIYINGRTEPPLQELRTMILEHGGIFTLIWIENLCTHIVATQLTPNKVKEYAQMKVVTPAWIVESVQQQALLPWRNYILRLAWRAANSSRRIPNTARPAISWDPASMIQQGEPSRSSEGPTDHSRTPSKSPDDPKVDDGDKGPEGETSSRSTRIPSYAPNPSNVHAARLMQDPKWRIENTSIGKISWQRTWKSELKILVKNAKAGRSTVNTTGAGVSMRGAELVIRNTSPLKAAPVALKTKNSSLEQVIMHCDFDSFFVSAGLVDRPELKGTPVVAGSTSEIASSSYEARKYGVKNGMSLGQAKKLCPQIQTIPYEFERYKDFSLMFYNVLLEYADNLEVVSVDEALLDVTTRVAKEKERSATSTMEIDHAEEIAANIRTAVREATGCEVSIGIGASVLLAKIATRAAKPAGTFHLRGDAILDHIAPLRRDAKDPGQMENIDLRGKGLGTWDGKEAMELRPGIDDRELKAEENRKSVSAAINYAIRFETNDQVEVFMDSLGREVASRMEADSPARSVPDAEHHEASQRRSHRAPKFLGHGHCDTFHYTAPIRDPSGSATADPTIIATQAWKLCQAHHSADTEDLRGIGISIQNLESEIDAAAHKQTKLSFAKQNYHSAQHSAHNEALDVFMAGPQEPLIVVDGPQDKATTPSESETKLPNLAHGAKHIAKQLAPTRSKMTSPTKYNIFNKRELGPVSISDAELCDLDIDPATFRAIPPDIQREQLTYQRMVHRNSRSTFGQSSRNHLAPDDRDSRSRSRSASVAPRTSLSMSARFAAIPSLKKARTTDELQDLISKWVSSCAESGPEEAATDSFRDFLLTCIADYGAGDCGLEKVVAVMKWWLYLCRRRWGDSELLYVADVEEEPVDPASMWWAAFRSVKHALDKVIGQRFGGMLSLQ